MLISRLPQGGGKGELHGASITIEADISLAGQTVELYLKGAMVKSGTLHDDASYLFTDILEVGTYTAEAGGFSGSVEVSADDILSKSAKNLIIATTVPITLTLEGAKEDTITITNASGKQLGVCVFTSGSTVGTVDVQINPDGENLTFESDIAKDTTTGTSDYSITVPITTSTTNVKVMPEGALYWYGNECVDVTGGWINTPITTGTEIWDTKKTVASAIKEKLTNHIKIETTASSFMECYLSYYTSKKINFGQKTKLAYFSETIVSGDAITADVEFYSNSPVGKSTSAYDYRFSAISNRGITTSNIASIITDEYILFCLSCAGRRTYIDNRLYALWIE